MSSAVLRALHLPDVLCLVFDEIVADEAVSGDTVYADDVVERKRKTLSFALHVSVVCRTWRMTALKMSELWTTLPPIVLPLEGTEDKKKIFADCIEELLRRSSFIRGISFDFKLYPGPHSSTCDRVVRSLLRFSTSWRAVSVVTCSVNSFDLMFTQIHNILCQLKSLSLTFLRPSDDPQLAHIAPLLRHATYLDVLDITNAEAVDANSWSSVPQYCLRTLHLTSEGFISGQQIDALKQISIPTVRELYLYTETTCPATIIGGMLVNTPRNVVDMLTLKTGESRGFNQGSISTMLRLLPCITSLEITLPALGDIDSMTNEDLAPSLHNVVFSDHSTLMDRRRAQSYGIALRALGEKNKFQSLMIHVEHSESIINDLEGWEETDRTRELFMATSKLASAIGAQSDQFDQAMRVLRDVRAIEGVNFGDIVGTMIDARLYQMVRKIHNDSLSHAYLAIITEIRQRWADILRSGFTCWDPFGVDADERIVLIYHQRIYDVETLLSFYDEF